MLFYFPGCNKENKEVDITKSQDDSLVTSTTSLANYLNVGVDVTFPPFAFLMGSKVSGFDVDLATEIAKRLEKELNIVQISYNEAFNKINDPSIDIIISGIDKDTQKESLVDFSDPYYISYFVMLALKAKNYNSEYEMINKKIGVLKFEAENLNPDLLSSYYINQYEDAVSLINALKSSEVDGILISIPIGVKILKDDPESYTFIQKIESQEKYYIIMKKDTGMKEKINKVLKEIKDDGTFEKIYNEWFSLDY
jgi:polar amino acid transport system substrate-binding protein